MKEEKDERQEVEAVPQDAEPKVELTKEELEETAGGRRVARGPMGALWRVHVDHF